MKVMTSPPEPQETPRRRNANPSAWPLALVLVVAILTGAGLWVFHTVSRIPGATVDRGTEALRLLGGELGTLAAAFRQGTVTTRFTSYASRVTGNTYLQFATLEQFEVFRRTDEATLAWGNLPLPPLVVEASAPVTYSYYLDLEGEWQFDLDGQVMTVITPPIGANPPAVDVSELRLEARTSSWFRDEEAALDKLRTGLSRMARERADEHVELVREIGRRQVEDFVRTWLVQAFGDGGDYQIEVVFADEAGRRELPSGIGATEELPPPG